MRKSNVKIKGKLRTYLYLPLLLTMLLIIINVFVYMEDTSSGVLFSGFVLLYFVIMLIAYLRNKPLILQNSIILSLTVIPKVVYNKNRIYKNKNEIVEKY